MSSHVFLWILSAASLAGGLVATACTRDPQWLERSGSLVIIAAALVEAFPLLRLKKAGDKRFWFTDEDLRAAKNVVRAVVLGTVVWGWGGPLARCLAQLFA